MDNHIYVDVAANGVHNRNKIHRFDKLITWDKHLVDTYTTYFRYTDEMKTHVSETGSVKGFAGSAYSPWIPFDIDSENLREAHQQLLKLLMQINKYGVSIDQMKVYFSGSKGFHALLPASLVDVKPSEDIHMRFRRFAKRIGNGVKLDMSIYDKVKLFRLPNTINSKSGKYKIQLRTFEITSMNAMEIKEKASEQREEWKVPEIGINDTLKSIYDSEEVQKPIVHSTSDTVKAKICLHRMMQGIGQGERDNAAVRIVDHLKKQGLTEDMVWSAINVWNNKNQPPLTEMELQTTFQQGMKEYNFGCNDFLLEKYCDKKCIFYKG